LFKRIRTSLIKIKTKRKLNTDINKARPMASQDGPFNLYIRSVANDVIKCAERFCRTRSRRDNDLVICAVGTITSSEYTWDRSSSTFIYDNLANTCALQRSFQPFCVRHETDLDKYTFHLQLMFFARFTIHIGDAFHSVTAFYFFHLC